MELMRLQTFYLVSIQLSDDSKINEPKDLIKFTWDEEKKVDIVEEPDWVKLDKEIKRS